MTTHRGLRVHQGKAKCGVRNQLQACTASACETRRTQCLVENHSAAETTIANSEREEPHQLPQKEVYQQQQEHSPQHELHFEPTSSEPTRETTPREKPTRQAKVRWPKASNKEEWRSFDQSLHLILQNSLAGSTTTKLNLFGNIVYGEGKERFGEMSQKKNTPKQKGRRGMEIHKLVKERRLLRKA